MQIKNEPPTGAIGNTHRNVNQAEGTWMVTPLRHWFFGRALNCFPGKAQLPQHLLLVGGFNHLEKYESQWEGLSHILWTNKKCSKPPTRSFIYLF